MLDAAVPPWWWQATVNDDVGKFNPREVDVGNGHGRAIGEVDVWSKREADFGRVTVNGVHVDGCLIV